MTVSENYMDGIDGVPNLTGSGTGSTAVASYYLQSAGLSAASADGATDRPIIPMVANTQIWLVSFSISAIGTAAQGALPYAGIYVTTASFTPTYAMMMVAPSDLGPVSLNQVYPGPGLPLPLDAEVRAADSIDVDFYVHVAYRRVKVSSIQKG
jgi:hypothetical protein